MASSLFAWAGVQEWRAESALVVREKDRFTATGVQLGVDPVPYRLDYRLETVAAWETGILELTAVGSGWRRSLRLGRVDGRWFCRADSEGDVDLPGPGCDPGELEDAVDCDLGFSPLTNTMPILRHRLHQQPGAVDFTIAWVTAPDLGVQPSPQRYEHLRTTPDGAVVAFSSGSLRAELTVDAGGIVLDYPGLARRVP